jgi:murein L,D-transpeptidase YafK
MHCVLEQISLQFKNMVRGRATLRRGFVLFALSVASHVSLWAQSPSVDSLNDAPSPQTTQSSEWNPKPASGDFYLLMDKSRSTLAVRSFVEPGKTFRVFHAISGSNPGDKIKTGDKKTPEGIYFIERRIPRNQLAALHGSAAFELNYPNPVDRILRRTGYGIWIHGVDNENRLQRRFDTRGCVATSNADILELASIFTLKNIPIVIVDSLVEGQSVGIETPGSVLHQRVLDWAAAWSSKDMDRYMAFYSPDFKSRAMGWNEWKAYKTRLARTYDFIRVTLRDIKVLRHGKYSVAVFDQEYVSNRFQSRSLKRLYLMGEPATAQIIAEEVAQEGIENSDSLALEGATR